MDRESEGGTYDRGGARANSDVAGPESWCAAQAAIRKGASRWFFGVTDSTAGRTALLRATWQSGHSGASFSEECRYAYPECSELHTVATSVW